MPDRSQPDRSPNHVLKAIAKAYGKHEALAALLDVSGSHLSNLCAGRKTITWEQVREVARRVIEDMPGTKGDIAAAFALHEWGVVLRPVPEVADVGDVRDELADVPGALGRLTDLVRRGAPEAEIEAAARDLARQSEEAGVAALRIAT